MNRKGDKVITPSDRFWRRLALAAAVSFGLHLAFAVWARPDFRQVADRAVAFEVSEITPGPPSPVPSEEDEEPPVIEPQGPPAPPAAQEPPEPPPEAPKKDSKGAIVQKLDTDPDTASDTTPTPDVDTDTATSSRPASTDTGTDADTDTDTAGGGTGICLHDLFVFAPPEPTWMLWVSPASLRGTVFEQDVAHTLGAYGITTKLERTTGLDPAEDVMSVLVTAKDILDWKTYRIAASHDVSEQKLKNTIAASYEGTAFSWRRTAQGWQAVSPDRFRYHLVASGRVLVVEALEEKTPRKKDRTDQDGDTEPPDTDSATPNEGDAGRSEDTGTGPGTDSTSPPRPPLHPGAYPAWPRQIRCLVEEETGGAADRASARGVAEAPPAQLSSKKDLQASGDFRASARDSLEPDDQGHWPVAYLTTTDPRAVGMPPEQGKRLGFRRVGVRGFFSEEKVRIWGRVYLEAPPAQIENMAAGWRRLAKASRGDPFVKMMGLSGVIENISVEPEPKAVTFSVELSAAQTRAALLFLQMQGEALSRRLAAP